MMTQGFDDCVREGRKAFRQHGVTGASSHSYPQGSLQREGFISGFNAERLQAAERAMNEAHAYHALTLRESAKDRAWAEKLACA
jgi:hypothetical protein